MSKSPPAQVVRLDPASKILTGLELVADPQVFHSMISTDSNHFQRQCSAMVSWANCVAQGTDPMACPSGPFHANFSSDVDISPAGFQVISAPIQTNTCSSNFGFKPIADTPPSSNTVIPFIGGGRVTPQSPLTVDTAFNVDDDWEVEVTGPAEQLHVPAAPQDIGLNELCTVDLENTLSHSIGKQLNSRSTKPKRTRERKVYVPKVKKYVDVGKDDVLLGRGGYTNLHAGNRRFHKEKEAFCEAYHAATKEQKTQHAQALVDEVWRYGGRFLAQDNQGWYVVHEHTARTKASQVLRDAKLAKKDRRSLSKQAIAENLLGFADSYAEVDLDPLPVHFG